MQATAECEKELDWAGSERWEKLYPVELSDVGLIFLPALSFKKIKGSRKVRGRGKVA